MLSSLSITNLALVAKEEIDFQNGFNVVTGETGAGKSIIIGAIRLLLGSRADKSLIRHGEKKAEVAAVIDLHAEHPLKKRIQTILENAGIDSEDSLLLRRVITNSSSRNYINGSQTSLKVLNELGSLLIEIFSPGEQFLLCQNTKQRQVLDQFLAAHTLKDKVAKKFHEWKKLENDLIAFNQDIPDRGECEILQFQYDEISQAEIEEGEDLSVQQDYDRVSSSEELMRLSHQSLNAIQGDEASLQTALQQSVRLIQEMASLDEENAGPILESLEECADQIYEVSRELDSYSSRLQLDPALLQELDERLGTIQTLKRKYGPEISDMLAYAEKIKARIDRAEHFDEERQKLEEQIVLAEQDFLKLAEELHVKRQKAANKLSKAIEKELKEIDFTHCQFSISLERSLATDQGFDHVEMLFAPNAGEAQKALKDTASSGEISRVMLAIKTILAQTDITPILIFDEIDANVGGLVASKIARKLHSLGTKHQVFCITHLPQVAAGGHAHYRVEKNIIDDRTITRMIPLVKDEKVEEISRMLGGEEISAVVREHAQELILSAQ